MKYNFTEGRFRSNGQELAFYFQVFFRKEYLETCISGVYSIDAGLTLKSVHEYVNTFECSFIAYSGAPTEQATKDSSELFSVLNCYSLKAKTFREDVEKFLKEFFHVDTIAYEQ